MIISISCLSFLDLRSLVIYSEIYGGLEACKHPIEIAALFGNHLEFFGKCSSLGSRNNAYQLLFINRQFYHFYKILSNLKNV